MNCADLQAEALSTFDALFAEALAAGEPDRTAMTLATASRDGKPSARTVLLKAHDERGFVFYTNFGSAKGEQILKSRKAALLFHWKSLRRQIRIRGNVSEVSKDEADAYFQSRDRGSRIGAWASKQSRPLESRFALEKAVAEWGLKFGVGAVPRPDYWSGLRIAPTAIEFWRDGLFRLHDRVRFLPDGNGGWTRTRLYP